MNNNKRYETRNTRNETQNVNSKSQGKKNRVFKIFNRFWRKIQFWKPTKYQELLGFREDNTKLYDIAFIHSSMSQRDKKGRVINNER